MFPDRPPEQLNTRSSLVLPDDLPLADVRLNPDLPSRYNPGPRTSSRATAIAGAFILLLILLWVGQPALKAGSTFLECLAEDCDPSGPAVAWSTQVAVAEQAAQGIDKDALLESVTAWPAARDRTTWTYTKTLQVVFNYMLPTGEAVQITFWDMAPSSTLSISRNSWQGPDKARYDQLAQSRQKDHAVFVANKLGPRDAVLQTWQEAYSHAHELGIKVYPILGLYADTWDITYWPTTGIIPQPRGLDAQFNLGYSSSFDIDGKTGATTRADNQYLQPTVTPAIP